MLRYAVTMAGVMFIAAQTGLAAIVFSDSFEGVPGDPGPDLASSTGDYDPAWQFVTEGLSSRQAVVYSNAIDTAAGSASALITAPAGQQALRLRAGGTAMAQSWLPTNAQVTVSLFHLEPVGNANTGKMFYFNRATSDFSNWERRFTLSEPRCECKRLRERHDAFRGAGPG